MSSEKTEAIVLRAVPWSETSLIVTLFTRDFGKISAMAKGARRPKSSFEGALDLLSHCRLVFLQKSGDVLDLLTEAKLIRRFRAGEKQLLSLYSGYYVAELLRELTDPGDSQPELFDLAVQTLQDLDRSDKPAEIVLRFEMQLLRQIGHQPNLISCVGCDCLIAEGAPVRLGVIMGGLLCSRCVVGQRSVIEMRPETRSLLRQLSEGIPGETPLCEIPMIARAESRAILQKYLTVHFDRRWELHRYIEDLAR